jgi:hypothetical protein
VAYRGGGGRTVKTKIKTFEEKQELKYPKFYLETKKVSKVYLKI